MVESHGHFKPNESDSQGSDDPKLIGKILEDNDLVGDVHDAERAAEVKRRDLADERRSSDKALREIDEELEKADADGRREPGVELQYEIQKDIAHQISQDMLEQKDADSEAQPPA